jgi:hypothetical protein
MAINVIVVGKPSAPPLTQYQLFLSSENPANYGTPAGSVNAGIAFFVTASCTLVAIRFYKNPGDTDTSHTVDLWDTASHAKLAEGVSSGEPASGWITVSVATPFALTPNKAYYATAYYAAGYYNYTSGYFSTNVVRGPITGYQDGTVPGGATANSGVYSFTSGPSYPSSGFNANYWADPVVAM